MIRPFEIRKIIALANLPEQHSRQAALWADYFAATFQSQVVLYDTVAPVTSDQDMPLKDLVSDYGVRLQSSFRRLKKLSRYVTNAHQVQYVSELGVPATNLISQATHMKADLIILNVPDLNEELPASLYTLLYGSPCPVFFARSIKAPHPPKKILVPIRLKYGLEQKIPAVIALAKAFNSTISLSAFEPYNLQEEDKNSIELKMNQFASKLEKESIRVETHTVQGKHFGQAMLQSVALSQADMLAIVIEPSNFMQRMFTKMMGKYFLEHSPIPVLAVPILRRTAKSASEPGRNVLLHNDHSVYVPSVPLALRSSGRPLNPFSAYIPTSWL